ncbi:hypothetical protein [Mesorhizobium sp. B3-1-6]|uniref:hypothetical protein n=1 Tax=Mesorhizobium sp. B3-1-6 TaxID=2589895 RepID=UPI001FEDCFBD|nr:hypothetical protein [Mesorhizobium sp. B3-1-6]
MPISVSISLIWPSASGADRADELRADLVLGRRPLHAGLHERREFVRDVMVGNVDVERLACGDLGLDAIGEREIGELGLGMRERGQQAERRRENDVSDFHG